MKITTATLISMLALGSATFAQNVASTSNTATAQTTEASADAKTSTSKSEQFHVDRMAAIRAGATLSTIYTARALDNAVLDGRNPLNVISVH